MSTLRNTGLPASTGPLGGTEGHSSFVAADSTVIPKHQSDSVAEDVQQEARNR